MKGMRVFALFLGCTLGAYGVNVLLRRVEWLGWAQFFVPTATTLLPGLAAGIFLGHRLQWLSLKATAGQYGGAALIVAASFPLGFFVMILLSIAQSIVVPESVLQDESALKRALDRVPVVLAAFVIPLLCWLSLRIVRRAWDRRVLVLMLAAVAAVLVSILLANALFGARAEDFTGAMFFPGFPVGFALMAGFLGYGLTRVR